MERLTTRYDGHAVMAWEYEEKYTTSEWIDMLTDRLAAYEDTGLEPEEVAELAQAEKDGRLVVLPCRVGDTVYIPLRDGVHGVRVMGIRISASGKDTVLHLDIGSGKFRWGSDKGRTWFSIQKEAEAALKKRDADNENETV